MACLGFNRQKTIIENITMQYTSLGKSGIKVSRVSFGCMSLPPDQETSSQLLRAAFDQGITFFDTADLYDKGKNEIRVGKALKEIRSKVIIATKVGNQWRPDGSGWDWNPRKEYILQAVDASLKRLQTDYLDLYQLHGGTLDDPIEETIEAFEQLKKSGKIREYGISSIRPNVIREYIKQSNLACVMMQYSLLDRRPEESCLDLLAHHQVSVLARGTLAQGLLAGKPPKPYLGYSQNQVQEMAEKVQAVADNQHTAATVATHYCLYQPVVATAVLGIRTEKQLQEALQAAYAVPLPAEEWHQLQNTLPPNYYEQHR